MRIAVNTCKDYRRTQWLRHRNQTSPIDELPEAVLPTTSVSRELFLTVMSLPDKYKQVVLLYHYQSMTMEEVADALRVSRPAVSRRLKRRMNCFAPSWKEEQNMNWDKDIQTVWTLISPVCTFRSGSRRRCLTAS